MSVLSDWLGTPVWAIVKVIMHLDFADSLPRKEWKSITYAFSIGSSFSAQTTSSGLPGIHFCGSHTSGNPWHRHQPGRLLFRDCKSDFQQHPSLGFFESFVGPFSSGLGTIQLWQSVQCTLRLYHKGSIETTINNADWKPSDVVL